MPDGHVALRRLVTSAMARRVVVVAAVSAAVVTSGCGAGRSTATTRTAPTTTSAALDAVAEPGTVPDAEPEAPLAETDAAIWPFISDTTRFSDPVAAATTFAATFIGFVDPVVGAFRPVDDRTGDVPVRAHRGGPITAVRVRRLAPDDTWWVLGATAPNLQLERPTSSVPVPPPVTISSPVTISGQSAAFKPTVNVQIRQDGRPTPLMEGLVDGGANGQLAPFATTLKFPQPDVPGGAIVLVKYSATDGNIAVATAVRVRFTDVASAHPAFDNPVSAAAGRDEARGR